MTNEEAQDLYKLFEQLSSDYYCTVVVGSDVRHVNVRLMDRTSFVLVVIQMRLQLGKSEQRK